MSLRGLSNIGDRTISEILEDNFVNLLDYSFAQAGGKFDITIPTSGFFAGDQQRLAPVKQGISNEKTHWQTRRQDWVWESGLNGINVSGVWLDDTFYPPDSAEFPHRYDYNNGLVIFESGINPTKAEIEYSYKLVNVESHEEIPFFQRPQKLSLRSDSPTFLQFGSGDFHPRNRNRAQFPIVAVEVGAIVEKRGFELGSAARDVSNRVFCHIVTEDKSMCKRLADIICDQAHKNIVIYNSNWALASGLPLNYQGQVVDSRLTYPTLRHWHRWKRAWISNGTTDEKVSTIQNDLYYCVATLTVETTLTAV